MGVRTVVRKPRVASLLRVLPLAPLVLIAVLTPAPREQTIHATAATGDVKLANSRGGAAIVSAAGMNPGDAVTGSVTISNSGDAPAKLALSKSQLVDNPGVGGGRLSDALYLSVDDLSIGRRVYEGPLASMPRFPLAPIPAGGHHAFRFVVRMSQTRGDAYQLSSTSVRFDWSATAGEKPVTPDTRAPRLVLSGKRRQRAKSRGLVVYARCDESCTLSATARAYGVHGVKRVKAKARVGAAAAQRRVAIRITYGRRALARLQHPSRGGLVVVRVTARDAAGNRTVRRRTIRLRPVHVKRPGTVAVLVGG